ncbi:hypothetical protein GUITHDRAFT_165189 [Guillardia theta CCMP2712]|uniref:PDZ domain-containing protein n=2 Tax=Guillardia theta TaxID=55529 RepID=L1IRN0_GUITC|nr:hypothetical protein GUITHDRAFT_165189 [Guillardia theta CCMP2712]EKX38559.1 hypothetical protein GUITHDRAFT_165189 [Guillardia theta CCMP2712]|eukprot:XP_005825539.1 hypothetical protein GUITHDRAFT_165189 [Guillardia theta CCMP2712]
MKNEEGAREGKEQAEDDCVIVSRTAEDASGVWNKVPQGRQGQQGASPSDGPQTPSGIWRFLPGGARNAFPGLLSASTHGSSKPTGQQASTGLKDAAAPLKFLGRDEWMCLIPLRVVAQEQKEEDGSRRFSVVSEGAFQLHLSGRKEGTVEVGEWSCRLYGPWGATLSERLFRFYNRFCPEKLGNVEKLSVEFGLGNEGVLNSMLMEAYGADLSSVTDENFSGGYFVARVRRIFPLTFLLEGVRDSEDEERVCSITFPTPMSKRSRFIESLEEQLQRMCDYRVEVDGQEVEAALQTDELAVEGRSEEYPGLIVNYAESSVPEKTGPLRVDEEGKSYYGVRIEAGGHQLASGLRTGSTWVAGQMVKGTDAFSKWIGPAAEEAKVSPGVQKALTYAQQGTEKLVDISCDIIGGLANIAAKGVSWGAEKVVQTETYKKWEKQPMGPRARAAKDVAKSTVSAVFSVGYGLKDAAHILLDKGLKDSVVLASHARWGQAAGDAARRSCESVLNLHYAAVTAGEFLTRGAVQVVGSLGRLMVLDAATKAVLTEDLKSGDVRIEGALLLNELKGFGGSSSVWNCYVCVARQQTIALYTPIVEQGVEKLADAGIKLSCLEEGGHKIVVEIERGSGAARGGEVEVGDVIIGVDGMSVQHMTVADVEALMIGAAGSFVRLQICKGKQMQVLADRVDELEEQQLDEDVMSKKEEEVDKPAVKEVKVERLHGRMADGFEQAVLEEAGDSSSTAPVEGGPSMSINASETSAAQGRKKEDLNKMSFMICNTRSGPAKLQRAILIQDVSKVSLLEPQEYGREHCFKLQIHSMKGVFAFQAADASLAQAWVQQILSMKEEYDELQKKAYFGKEPAQAQQPSS